MPYLTDDAKTTEQDSTSLATAQLPWTPVHFLHNLKYTVVYRLRLFEDSSNTLPYEYRYLDTGVSAT